MIAVLLFSTAIPTRGLAFQNAALNRSSQGQTGWNHRPRATSRQVLNMNISRTGYKVAPSISFLENFFTCQPAPSVFNSTCSVKREFCSFRCVIFRQVALFEQIMNQAQAWIQYTDIDIRYLRGIKIPLDILYQVGTIISISTNVIFFLGSRP